MRIRRISFILIILSLLCQLHGNVLAGEPLRLTLTFDKEEYKETDQINVDFTLKNIGKKPIYVNKRFFLNSKDSPKEQKEIYLSVTSPSGKELPCSSSTETGLPKTEYFILLNPGEEVSLDRQRSIKYFFDFTEPGIYKVVAVYQNVYGDEIGLDAFKDRIESNPVTIKIVE